MNPTTTSPTTSRQLVEECLARALAPEGQGRLVFTRIDAERARREAAAVEAISPIAGLPISVKDLFDVAGEVTTAGSPQLAGHAPATADAPAIARLRRAGAVIIGRTNMTEFAFSGVGINPHFGTPANPYQRERRRIPGGSSAGGAVSVADGMALAAIGSDTGGSVRIPAALCGLTGFKPTQRRVPVAGVYPLSETLDSVGPIARTVAACAALDAVMAGEDAALPAPADLAAVRFAVPTNYFLDGLDPRVARAFEAALAALERAGAKLPHAAFPEIAEIAAVNAGGGFAAAEGFRFHQREGTDLAACDPRVGERILRGSAIGAAEYAEMVKARAAILARFQAAHGGVDCILCPTVPLVAPEIAALENDAAEFRRVNLLLIRNPSVVNFLDRCALSLPCHAAGEAPAGLMLIGRPMGDRDLLAVGLAVERILRRSDQ
jgi:aspartyl-tRNA(Asn)/glutamyl-tRNA(Gln) amidotransferase subunit A